MALPATDSFTNSNGTQLTTHSSDWTLNNGDFDIQSNALCSDAWVRCLAHWNADTFDDDQYSECTVNTVGSHWMGLSVRCAAAAHTGYLYRATSGQNALFRIVAGSETQLGSTINTGVSATDEMRLEAEGTTITPYINSSTTNTPGAQTDATLSSGSAGVHGRDDYTTTQIDDWEGGDLGGGGLSIPVAMHHYMHQTG